MKFGMNVCYVILPNFVMVVMVIAIRSKIRPFKKICLAIIIDLKIVLHTYKIFHYNPSVRVTDLVSHTTFVVVCVNFIHKRRDRQFKVYYEQQIFLRNFSWQCFIYSKSFCQKSTESKSPKKYFFISF